MKLTQKKVKDLIALNTKDIEEKSIRYVIACGRKNLLIGVNREDMAIIAKYNWLRGQIYAYKKILQIMQLKV